MGPPTKTPNWLRLSVSTWWLNQSAGVQVVVADEPEGAAVEAIGAALGGDADHRAGRKAVLGAEVVGDDLELLGGVGVREGRGQQVVVVHVGDAVEHIEGAALAAAGGEAPVSVGKEKPV